MASPVSVEPQIQWKSTQQPGWELHHKAKQKYPDQGDGYENLPAEPHDLIIAVTRESSPEPEKTK
jgi:hypothetical protein